MSSYFPWSTQDLAETIITHNFKAVKIIKHILKYPQQLYGDMEKSMK